MRAIILAAGEGKRLRPHTVDRPKCLVELAGKPLLAHQIEALESAGVTDITVVTGYRGEQVEAVGRPTRCNTHYTRTNMVASLMCAADLLDGGDDVLIAYADIIYEPRVIAALLDCPAPLCTTIDTSWLHLWRLRMADPLSDAETLKLDRDGNILELGRRPVSYDDIQGQYMGLLKVRADFAGELVLAYEQLDGDGLDGNDRDNVCMTSFLQHFIDHGQPVQAVLVDGGWVEVDSAHDLELYNALYHQRRLDKYCKVAGLARVFR